MNSLRKPITVVLADDHEVFRRGLQHVLQYQAGSQIQFVGEAANGIELIEQVKQRLPDIVLTDIQMPEMNGIEACKIIRKNFPCTSTIALSLSNEPDFVMNMVLAGARGYLVKSSTSEEIIEAIKSVSTGAVFYSSTVSDQLYGKKHNYTFESKPEKVRFTCQELSVMKLLCQQLTTKEIASKLGLAKRTIEDYRHHIQEKIGAKNMVGIAIYAIFNEIVKFGDLL